MTVQRLVVALPETIACLACLREQEMAAFQYRAVKRRGPNGETLREIHPFCRDYRGAEQRGRLFPAQRRRMAQVRAAIAAELKAFKAQQMAALHRTTPRTGKRICADPPYDRVVAAMTAELGRPPERWTPAEHAESTLRTYDLLGWPRPEIPPTITRPYVPDTAPGLHRDYADHR